MTELLKGYKKDFETRNALITKYMGVHAPFILKEDGDWLEITTPYNHIVMRVKEDSEGIVSLNRLNRTTTYLCDNFNQLYLKTSNEMLRMRHLDMVNIIANDLQTMSDNDKEYNDGLFTSYVHDSAIFIISSINNCCFSFQKCENGVDWEYVLENKSPLLLGSNNINKIYQTIKDIVKNHS